MEFVASYSVGTCTSVGTQVIDRRYVAVFQYSNRFSVKMIM